MIANSTRNRPYTQPDATRGRANVIPTPTPTIVRSKARHKSHNVALSVFFARIGCEETLDGEKLVFMDVC
jgi:hypothetical protein